MKDMHRDTARKMGGTAMTRRSITAVLASLLIGLLVTVNVPSVSACEVDDAGHCIPSAPGDANLVSVASVGPAAAVAGIDYRFNEINTTTLSSVSNAVTSEYTGIAREQYDVMLAARDARQFSAATHVESGYAPENYEQMASVIPTN
jgi:hypothetical protein